VSMRKPHLPEPRGSIIKVICRIKILRRDKKGLTTKFNSRRKRKLTSLWLRLQFRIYLTYHKTRFRIMAVRSCNLQDHPTNGRWEQHRMVQMDNLIITSTDLRISPLRDCQMTDGSAQYALISMRMQ
jgi:hypothetical protein